jgi:hypothetical protein
VPHPDPEIDLCGIKITTLLDHGGPLEDLYHTPITSSSIPALEEQAHYPAIMQIAMIGYPTGLWDAENNLPILRRGTTASHPAIDFDGRPEVLVDIACFPGSSGSPVILHDTEYFAGAVRFLGVLHAGPDISLEGEILRKKVPINTDPAVRVSSMIHLGYIIKASKVLELTKHIASRA